MIKPRQISAVIPITLAELAWLAAFGLMFAYRGKVGELGNTRRQLHSSTNLLAQWEAKSLDTAKLLGEVNQSVAENGRLRERLAVFGKSLGDLPPEVAARRLTVAAKFEKKVADAEASQRALQRTLDEKTEAEVKARAEATAAQVESAKLRAEFAKIPTNTIGLDELLLRSQMRVVELEKQLIAAQVDSRKSEDTIRQREVGEFSVRRELTGLPDKELRRVIFLVDTSTSMRNSPAWASARKLMRTWLEFLPVEECVLVSFSDKAVGFPKDGYHRVRQPDGSKMVAQREELLRVFDKAPQGIYTDLLLGLRRAYEYPAADVIVLFTDGAPHIGTRSDSVFAQDIFKEASSHPRIPVLTVALGSYEIEGAGGPRPKINAPVSFLKELARQTGGNFLAR